MILPCFFYLPYLSILSYYLTAFTVYLYQITSLYILSFYFHNWLADQPIIYWLLNNTYINPPKKFFSELQSTPKVLFRTHLFFLSKKKTKKKQKKTKKTKKIQQKNVHPKKFFSELQSNPTVLFRTHLFLSVCLCRLNDSVAVSLIDYVSVCVSVF